MEAEYVCLLWPLGLGRPWDWIPGSPCPVWSPWEGPDESRGERNPGFLSDTLTHCCQAEEARCGPVTFHLPACLDQIVKHGMVPCDHPTPREGTVGALASLALGCVNFIKGLYFLVSPHSLICGMGLIMPPAGD